MCGLLTLKRCVHMVLLDKDTHNPPVLNSSNVISTLFPGDMVTFARENLLDYAPPRVFLPPPPR